MAERSRSWRRLSPSSRRGKWQRRHSSLAARRPGLARAPVKVAILGVLVGGFVALAAAPALAQQAQPRGPGSPARFLARVVRLLVANRFADAWVSLNPTDQAIAPLPGYVACESQRPIPARLVSLRVVRVSRDRIGVAVTFVLRLRAPAVPDVLVVRMTRHAVLVKHRWTWILSASRRLLYRKGCSPPPGPPA